MTAKIKIGDQDHEPEFKPLNCNFEKDVEIVQIMSTSVANEL